MASIRKTKKTLKRKIRILDAAIIELLKHEGAAPSMWDLFLWRNYLEHKTKFLGKEEPNPWMEKDVTRFALNEFEQRNIMDLIKGVK